MSIHHNIYMSMLDLNELVYNISYYSGYQYECTNCLGEPDWLWRFYNTHDFDTATRLEWTYHYVITQI